MVFALIPCFVYPINQPTSDTICQPTDDKDTIVYSFQGVDFSLPLHGNPSWQYMIEYHNINSCQIRQHTLTVLPISQPTIQYDTICWGETYIWNGIEYNTTGSYTDTLTNIYGCDSIVTLCLTILPEVQYFSADTLLCHGVACHWRDQSFTSAGIYNDTIRNTLSCDSLIYTLHLAYLPATQHIEAQHATICHGENYVWREKEYNTSGIYTDTVRNRLNGDSLIYSLNLIVNYATTFDTIVVACDHYEWLNETYFASGVFVDTLTNTLGCDSIVTLHLTINYSDTAYFNAVACDSYTWHGVEYTTSGTYQFDTLTTLGCDSTLFLDLTINYSDTAYFNAVACDSYTWHGMTYTTSGVYVDTLINSLGCDSIEILYLTINTASPESVVYDTICYGDTYLWQNKYYTLSGTYQDTLLNMHGCDSIVTLHLHVYSDPPLTFTVRGVTFNMMRVRAGTFMMGATLEQGTDALSVEKPAHQVTLTRDYYIAETMLTQELWTAVMGTTIYEEEAKTNTITGLGYGDNYPMYPISWYDCQHFVDSLSKITGFTFRMPTEAEWEYAARGGHLSQGYKYPGSNDANQVAWSKDNLPSGKVRPVKELLPNELGIYDMAGNAWEWIYDFNREYTNSAQIDPIGDLTSELGSMRGGSTCFGNSYNRVSSRNIYYSKNYKHTRVGFRFVLDANQVLTENNESYVLYDTICYDQTYTWNDSTYDTSGQYVQTLTNIYGCDSIVTLYLTILPEVQYFSADTLLCHGVACHWRGQSFTSAGIYNDTIRNTLGCDSLIYTLHLAYLPATQYIESQHATICHGENYVWREKEYNTAGIYTDTVRNILHGDSLIYSLNLIVNYATTFDTIVVACDHYEWLNETYSASGVFVDTLTNTLGCDSIVTLHLTVNYTTTFDTTVVVCDSFNWLGKNLTTSGLYIDTLTNTTGCDSIVTLNLTVNYTTTYDTTVVACDNYEWLGKSLTTSDIYVDTLTNKAGCDSIVTLNLTVNYTTTYDTTVVACDNYDWLGKSLNTSGIYVDTLTNKAGCDSIVTLNLTVNYTTTYDTTVVACDNYEWLGKSLNTSGIYVDTLTNNAGCYSIVTLNLTVNYTTTYDTTVVACDTFEWLGKSFTTSGIYVDTLTNKTGCDSIVTLNLTVNYTTTYDTTVVACDNYEWLGKSLTTSGIYVDTLTNNAGCDSIVTLDLTINYGDTIELTHTACDSYTWHGVEYTTSGTYYYNTLTTLGCDSLEVLHLTINYSDTAYFTHTACDSYTWHDVTYTTSGTYQFDTLTVLGCDSILFLDLVVNYSDTAYFADTACDSYTWHGVEYTTSGTYYYNTLTTLGCDSLEVLYLTINYGDTIELTHTACDSYTWHGNTYTTSGTYYQHFQNQYGCDSLEVLHLTVNYTYHTTQVDTMAGYNPYYWHGDTLLQAGEYTRTFTAATNCDSIITLHLIENPVAIELADIPEICAGDSIINIPINMDGYIDYLQLIYSFTAHQVGFRDTTYFVWADELQVLSHDVRAGVYDDNLVAFFHQEEVLSQTLTFKILYPTTIFEQQWNDLISVLTAKYNGGYDFTAFQWYKDGEMLHNETNSYLHQSLSFGSEYSVLLTDPNGLQLMSCPFVPIDMASISIYPTIVNVGEQVKCSTTEDATIMLFNSVGKVVGEYHVVAGEVFIEMPTTSGMYMFKIFTTDNNQREIKVLVR